MFSAMKKKVLTGGPNPSIDSAKQITHLLMGKPHSVCAVATRPMHSP